MGEINRTITDTDRKEYMAILLGLCGKYGIEPWPEMFNNIDQRILASRERFRGMYEFAEYCGKALRARIDCNGFPIEVSKNG